MFQDEHRAAAQHGQDIGAGKLVSVEDGRALQYFGELWQRHRPLVGKYFNIQWQSGEVDG
jgi:hypothetical protein